jgi:Family of unknown function (DUF5309)
MAFTGKATYSAGTALPELTEDVADLVSVISPHEAPLLELLGDPLHEATSPRHEWLEDALLPNKDAIDDTTWSDPDVDPTFNVEHGSRFRVGDQIQVQGSEELMLVTAVDGNELTVVRGYAGTTAENLADNQVVNILGNAALEGDDKPAARFTNRIRCANYTQIFTAAVEVSGSDLAARPLGLVDEMEHQKLARLQELLRDLENSVLNGGQAAANPQGSGTVRRTMKGIIQHLATNLFRTGDSGFPTGTDLDEAKLNYALRKIWENSSAQIDLIVVGGFQKRKINTFCSDSRRYAPTDTTFRDHLSAYESDFGLCRIVTTRWVPPDVVLLLDSARISVLPLAGRSFHFKPLASGGDYECGELIGEYTLELRNEAAHGIIRDLATS